MLIVNIINVNKDKTPHHIISDKSAPESIASGGKFSVKQAKNYKNRHESGCGLCGKTMCKNHLYICIKKKNAVFKRSFPQKRRFFHLFRPFLCQLFGFALYLALMAELSDGAH